ncbi:magnesium ion transporter [Stygiomarasmius scandens]|uniref:Magnesium ion transporter n=1 Tax=Marasmiellus scandens TaxID=2682957 RepID=A0ABR1J691_9AGAR
MEDDIDHDRFKRLLHYSRRLASFQNRARLVGEALEEGVVDEDLDAMYLSSDEKNGVTVSRNGDHEDLEVLLEMFHKQVKEVVNGWEYRGVSFAALFLQVANMCFTQANVQSTQEIVELILDSNRNASLSLDLLQMSIATFGVGTGALIAGLFVDKPHRIPSLRIPRNDCHLWTICIYSGFAGFRKLTRIKRVGLNSSYNGRQRTRGRCKEAEEKKRKPWLPLPLRRG